MRTAPQYYKNRTGVTRAPNGRSALHMKVLIALTLAVAVIAAGCGQGTTGEEFPASGETMRLIVPFDAGGGIDTAARGLAPLLEEELGIPTVVENVPGAGGELGASRVYGQEGNPYYILVNFLPAMSIAELVFDADFEALGFEPLHGYAENRTAIAVPENSEYSSIDELLAAGPITFGHPGGAAELQAGVLSEETDLDLSLVPYAGMGPASVAVAGGEVDAGIIVAAQIAGNDQLRALAVVEGATEALPDVPPLADAMGSEVPIVPQIGGFFGPPGLEADAIARLSEALEAIIGSDEWAEFAETTGAFSPADIPRDELTALAEEGHRLVTEYGHLLDIDG